MIQIRILIVLLASVMSMNIWAQTAFEFDFDAKSLKNTGTKSGTATSIGKPITSDSVLYLNGESGIEIIYTGNIEVVSLLFQSDIPISPDRAGKTLFHSIAFGAYVSKFTNGLTKPYIGWSVASIGKVSGATNHTIDMNWHHFMLVYKDGIYKIFLDGVELVQSSTNTSSLSTPVSASALRFGINVTGVNGFRGSMDNIKIYNKALSGEDLAQLISTEKLHVKNLNAKFADDMRTKARVHLKFNGNYENSGFSSASAKPLGTAFVSQRDSVLVLDGQGGVGIEFEDEIRGYSFLFKAVEPITAESPRQIIVNSQNFNGYFSDFTNSFSDEVIGFTFHNSSSFNAYSNADPVDTLWHHLLFRFTEDDKHIELYIDGKKKNISESLNASFGVVKTGTLTLGTTSKLLNSFKGYIDEVMIYADNIYDIDLPEIIEEQKKQVEKLNTKSLSSLMSPMGAYFKFENNLEDEIGGANLIVRAGTERYKTDVSGNTVLELDGKTALFSPYISDKVGAFSCYFKLNEEIPILERNGAKMLFSTYFNARKYILSIGDVTGSVDNEVISVVLGHDDVVPSVQYTTGYTIGTTSWNHLFINYDASKSEYDVYFNGQKMISTKTSYPREIKLEGFLLGAIKDNLPMRAFLNAHIDEVKFYRNTQPDDVITESYNEFVERKNSLDLVTSFGLREHLDAVSVYPNPLTDEMKLIIKGVDNPHYRVLTMDGSILTQGQGEEIALPSACKGIFMVEVIGNHGRNVFKVVR